MPDVRVEDANGVERVLLGNLGTDDAPDYGLRVKSSDGTTVIIDGTSDIFKIAESGTLSLSVVNNSSGSTTASITSGNLAMGNIYHTQVGPVKQWYELGTYWLEDFGVISKDRWVAATSGGAVTTQIVGTSAMFHFWISWPTVSAAYTLSGWNAGTGLTLTLGCKYYGLTQVAL